MEVCTSSSASYRLWWLTSSSLGLSGGGGGGGILNNHHHHPSSSLTSINVRRHRRRRNYLPVITTDTQQRQSSTRYDFSPLLALGTNVNEDTDDMFDDLFKRYGKVVYKSKDRRPPTAEVDDDAESLSFAVALAKIASDSKGADIKVLFVKPLVYWTRFFIIATAFNSPQINAIRTKIADFAEENYGKVAMGDTKANSWTLMDFGDVIVHIFLPEQRALYNLEEFYANAPLIDLPFENQQTLRG